jgi:hypothetical protein
MPEAGMGEEKAASPTPQPPPSPDISQEREGRGG